MFVADCMHLSVSSVHFDPNSLSSDTVQPLTYRPSGLTLATGFTPHPHLVSWPRATSCNESPNASRYSGLPSLLLPQPLGRGIHLYVFCPAAWIVWYRTVRTMCHKLELGQLGKLGSRSSFGPHLGQPGHLPRASGWILHLLGWTRPFIGRGSRMSPSICQHHI